MKFRAALMAEPDIVFQSYGKVGIKPLFLFLRIVFRVNMKSVIRPRLQNEFFVADISQLSEKFSNVVFRLFKIHFVIAERI